MSELIAKLRDTSAWRYELGREAADEIESLRAQVAALTVERDKWEKSCRGMATEKADVWHDLAAEQLRSKQLREALEWFSSRSASYLIGERPQWVIDQCKALALPSSTDTLDAALKAERERCAKVCEELGMLGHWHFAASIRSRP